MSSMENVGLGRRGSAMILSLLYVSQSTLKLPQEAGEVDKILQVAQERNPTLEITGLLASTEGRFAQVLEGPAAHVDELMARIARDTRHRDVTVVRRAAVPGRQFAEWAMGYNGSSMVVDRYIKPLLQQGNSAERARNLADELMGLMVALRERLDTRRQA